MDFTPIQLRILEGCLLGDGHLDYKKDGHNSCFAYTSSSKEHTEFILKSFEDFCSENYQKPKRREYFDARTNKTYTTYFFRTKCLPCFTEQRIRWYKERKKIVPKDLLLSKESILYWYIGDGEMESNNGYIKLHTNSFTKEEVDLLCSLLGLDSKPQRKEEDIYLVTVPRRKTKDFLNLIGSCPIQDYAHKWKEVPYKNKNIELNGVSNYKSVYPELLKDWETGKYTVYRLAKKYKQRLS